MCTNKLDTKNLVVILTITFVRIFPPPKGTGGRCRMQSAEVGKISVRTTKKQLIMVINSIFALAVARKKKACLTLGWVGNTNEKRMYFSTNRELPSTGLLNWNCCQPLDGRLLFVQNDILFSSMVGKQRMGSEVPMWMEYEGCLWHCA